MASRDVTWQNRCINCSFSIPRNQRTHTLEQVSTQMLNLLQSWITPTQLTSDFVLCTECLTLLQDRANTTSEGSLSLPALGHKRVCFSCGKSILRTTTRTYPVRQDRLERNIIIRLVPLHLISRLERVCGACWRSATREVRRYDEQDSNRPGLSTGPKLMTGTEDDENETNTKHNPKQCVAASEFTLSNVFIKQEITEEISNKNAEGGEIAASQLSIPSVFIKQEKKESSSKEEKDDAKVASELAIIPSVFIKQEIIEECSIKKEKDDEIVTSELIIPPEIIKQEIEDEYIKDVKEEFELHQEHTEE